MKIIYKIININNKNIPIFKIIVCSIKRLTIIKMIIEKILTKKYNDLTGVKKSNKLENTIEKLIV